MNHRIIVAAILTGALSFAACAGSEIYDYGQGGGSPTGVGSSSGGEVCRGLTLCDDACVDTDVDPKNCGACGEACPEGQVCDGSGACSLECVGGTTRCGDVCVDTDVDFQNCGGCGIACEPGEMCDGSGSCVVVCKPDELICDGRCVDPLTDASYCGATGDCLGPNAGEDCNGGECHGGTCILRGCHELVGVTNVSGTYQIDPDGSGGAPPFSVYCDMATDGGGWTLIARFSNADAKNWMLDNGEWWYDLAVETGNPLSRSDNADMISKAFWTVKGDVLKITRTDNFDDSFLLQTSAGCLGNKTFREFITGFGNFRNGTWRINGTGDGAHGHCPGTLGNNFSTTMGFAQAQCSNGSYGSIGGLSFWSAFGQGDGAVIQIGPGGTSCTRADHGIGTTEANHPSFVFSTESDFGNDAGNGDPGYALNLFIK